MRIRAALVVPAGGAGRRLGGVRKQYLELCGEPVLVHALRPFLAHPAIEWVVVALPAEDASAPPAWLTGLDPRITVVAGGAERCDSVRNGVAAVPEAADVIVVHDAARPLVTGTLVDRVLSVAAEGVGAVVAIPMADTVKSVGPGGFIERTVDRSRLWRAQTPQAFPREMLVRGFARPDPCGPGVTDEAALVESVGGAVRVVEGSAENLKITGPEDLALAEFLLARRRPDATADPNARRGAPSYGRQEPHV
ncbi:MAG TPA: 2-C-methyl-D-erythritol 4-phosphate cytidylyltransferase [Longimicrobiales bacterium]|nr:2-C-methyl-D-erythritol 4-phosphate cytidylyltransferase [Longimicrobiales bacterium]